MFLSASTITLSLVLGAIARPDPFTNSPNVVQERDTCVTGAHIVGVRGTTEKPGFGALKAIADELQTQIPDSDQYAIDYPAAGINIQNISVNPIVYSESEDDGYNALKEHLQNYTTACPAAKIVLLGYSQGAHVVGDALCGWHGSGILFPAKEPVAVSIKNQVRATIQLGDPTNNIDLRWHVGNSTRKGFFPRSDSDFQDCGDATDNWQSYCDAGDPFCDRGFQIKVHLEYVPEYKDDIVKYVVGKVNETSPATS